MPAGFILLLWLQSWVWGRAEDALASSPVLGKTPSEEGSQHTGLGCCFPLVSIPCAFWLEEAINESCTSRQDLWAPKSQ